MSDRGGLSFVTFFNVSQFHNEYHIVHKYNIEAPFSDDAFFDLIRQLGTE